MPFDDSASSLPPPALRPVEVTRWSARLADPECEREYLARRFADDRRRLYLLMALVAGTAALIFLGRLYHHVYGLSPKEPLYPPLVSLFMPLLGVAIFRNMRTPRTLEFAVIVMCSLSCVARLAVLTLQTGVLAMWLPLMVMTLFVVYLCLPVRFVVSAGLAVAFSVVTPIWWCLLPQIGLSGVEIYRGILWLLLTNALGFTVANSLQRGQRTQFAQSLVLQQLLSTDALTGIANRRLFDEALDREWRRCARTGLPLSLLMIDVDHFKAYNDLCGHQQGDDCLRLVARLLVSNAGRAGDLVARYGGEEFVCLMPGVDETGAQAVAEQMVQAIRQAAMPHPHSPSASRLTVSIGAAAMSPQAAEPHDLLAFADRLLYAAKAAGRDRVMSGAIRCPRLAAPVRWEPEGKAANAA